MTNLIGLIGKAGAGKDTLADVLQPYGYARVAFADALKQSAYDTDPIIEHFHPGSPAIRLSTLVDAHGWDYVKTAWPDARRYLQRHGVAMREQIPGCWVSIAAARIGELTAHGHHVTVTDVRFDDEVSLIRRLGGAIVRVDRRDNPLDLGAHAVHVSEQLVDRVTPDYVIDNDSSVGHLRDLAAELHMALCDAATLERAA